GSTTNTVSASAAITGVSSGTHLFQVRAQDANGMWGPSADFQLIVTNAPGSSPPGAPVNLVCDHATNGVPARNTTFTFSWAVPPSQSGVAGYSYAMDQPAPNSVLTVGTSATFSAVPVGTHLFHVKAIGANGVWGPTSDFVLMIAPKPIVT